MYKKLGVALAILLGNICTVWATGPSPVDVVLFTSPYCGHCYRLKHEFLDTLKADFAGKANIIEYDVTKPGNNVIFNDTLDEFGAEFKGVPAMVVGKKVLMGYPSQIRTEGPQAIEEAWSLQTQTLYGTKSYIAQCKKQPISAKPKQKATAEKAQSVPKTETAQPYEQADSVLTAPLPRPEVNKDTQPCEDAPVLDGKAEAKALFEQITLVAIIAAGLIDGINPCAFAVIVFFVSFLAAYKYNRREIVLVGSAYCLSVFIAYVLIGLGLFNFLYAMRSFYYVMMAFKWLTIGLCALFLVLSLYDFVIYTLTKNHAKILLQLPKSYKEYIHKVMRVFLKDKHSSTWRLVAAALCVGFVVSLVEAVCTGQVYLPTIALILKEAGAHFWRAMLYLIVYNLMFVVPLIVILVMSIIGYESSTFNGFFKKHLGLTRLLLALLFLGLLILLLFNM